MELSFQILPEAHNYRKSNNGPYIPVHLVWHVLPTHDLQMYDSSQNQGRRRCFAYDMLRSSSPNLSLSQVAAAHSENLLPHIHHHFALPGKQGEALNADNSHDMIQYNPTVF